MTKQDAIKFFQSDQGTEFLQSVKNLSEAVKGFEAFFTSLVQTSQVEASKKRKRIKDPDAPKQPMTSFLLYARETRHKVKEEFPHYSMKEIAAKLGEMWRALNDEEKESFVTEANILRTQFNQDVEDYKKIKEEPSSQANVIDLPVGEDSDDEDEVDQVEVDENAPVDQTVSDNSSSDEDSDSESEDEVEVAAPIVEKIVVQQPQKPTSVAKPAKKAVQAPTPAKSIAAEMPKKKKTKVLTPAAGTAVNTIPAVIVAETVAVKTKKSKKEKKIKTA